MVGAGLIGAGRAAAAPLQLPPHHGQGQGPSPTFSPGPYDFPLLASGLSRRANSDMLRTVNSAHELVSRRTKKSTNQKLIFKKITKFQNIEI